MVTLSQSSPFRKHTSRSPGSECLTAPYVGGSLDADMRAAGFCAKWLLTAWELLSRPALDAAPSGHRALTSPLAHVLPCSCKNEDIV